LIGPRLGLGAVLADALPSSRHGCWALWQAVVFECARCHWAECAWFTGLFDMGRAKLMYSRGRWSRVLFFRFTIKWGLQRGSWDSSLAPREGLEVRKVSLGDC